MRTRLGVIFLFLWLILPVSVGAQSALKLASLKVSLWSEYDQPSMLVIYDLQVDPATQLPTRLDVRIPSDGNITAVAFIDPDGQMLNTEYAGPRTDGKWQVITLFIKQAVTYRVEYYQSLQRVEDGRVFDYQWAGDYAVDNFSLEVKIPGDSTAIQTTPNLLLASEAPFLIGSLSPVALEAGSTYQVTLNYTRTSEETVFAPTSPQVDASEPIAENTAGRVTLNNLPYILGAVGVLLIVGAIYYFQRNTDVQMTQTRKRSGKASNSGAQVYCHECGTRAVDDDRFCRTCGTKLRQG